MCRVLGDTEQTGKGLVPGLQLHFKCLHMGKRVKPSRMRSEYLVSVQLCQQHLIMLTVLCSREQFVYCSILQLCEL